VLPALPAWFCGGAGVGSGAWVLDAYLDGRSSGPLFITAAGKRMSQSEAWKMARRIARRASLDGAAEIRPHSLRVAFITGAREAGVRLEDVQDAAGHADPRTTRRYDRGAIPSIAMPRMPSRRGWQDGRILPSPSGPGAPFSAEDHASRSGSGALGGERLRSETLSLFASGTSAAVLSAPRWRSPRDHGE
jgi:hypothetical protein